MPTARPRHTLTETDELSLALREAARHWPDDAESKSRLLLRLIEAGRQVIDAEDVAVRQRRQAAVRRTRGQFRGLYGPDYLQQLRDEWPA